MSFYLKFENTELGKIPLSSIGSLSFTSGIFKLYSACKVMLRDPSKTYNNILKTGMPVDVVFVNEDEEFVNKMKIQSINKYSEGLMDFFDLILVNSLKFENKICTASYYGTVSSIIEDIIKSKYSTEIGNNYNIEKSEEVSRRRYQLSESTVNFIQRILKYGIKEKLPVYLYFDSTGKLNLKSAASMIKANPKYIIHSIQADQAYQIPNNSNLNKKIYINHSIYSSGKNSCSTITSYFTSDNFRNNDIVLDSLVSTSTSFENSQVYSDYPEKVVFYPWNLTPDDAIAIAAKNSFEENVSIYGMTASFNGIIVKDFNISDVVYVILPYEPSAINNSGQQVNLSEGKYLITNITYVFDNELLKTNIDLVQIAS